MNGWSFLVSRTHYVDYRTIIAPDFICQARSTLLLAEAAEGDLTELGMALYREIHNSKVGDLTLVYRVVKGTPESIGINREIKEDGKLKNCVSSDGFLKDYQNREIVLIEGLIFQGLIPDIIVTQEDLDSIHQQMMEHYRKQWDYITNQPVIPSQSFTLTGELAKCLKYIKFEEYIAGTQQLVTTLQPSHIWESKPAKFDAEITSVIFSPNGQSLIIRCDENAHQVVWVCCLNGSKNYPLKGTDIPWNYSTPATISPNGKFIASAMIEKPEQNVVMIWNIETSETRAEPKKLYGHQSGIWGAGWWGRVNTVAFTFNSETLASAGEDKTIFIWDVISGGKLGQLEGHKSPIKALTFSKDGLLASGDGKGEIKIWNWQSQKPIHDIPAHKLPVNCLAFSPNGQILASGSDDYTITLFDPKTGQEIRVLGQHFQHVNSISFSPDGKLLASGSDDCKIKIWDLQNKDQKAIAELEGHTKAVTSVAFSPDGKFLVSGSKDCTIRLWSPV